MAQNNQPKELDTAKVPQHKRMAMGKPVDGKSQPAQGGSKK